MNSPFAGLDRGTRLAIVAMAAGVFLIANDFTAFSVVIPEIEQDLDTTLTRAQWVINGYSVVFAMMIVTAGRLADLYGRRRIFMIGGAIFAVFSLVGGLAPTIEVLIASRALMGIGGALIWPAVLGLTYAILPDEKAGLAGGIFLGVAGLGNAIGPLIGGGLSDALSWRWVFFVNIPITAIAMWLAWRNVDESKDTLAERRIDYRGIVTLSLAVVAIMVALDQGTTAGFGDPVVVALLAIGVVLLGVFALIERREGSTALVPRTVMENRQFAAACATVLGVSVVFFGVVIYVPQFLEKGLGFSAGEAGAGLLPMMIVYAITAFVAGNLYDRLGAKTIVCSGAGCLAVGVFLLSFLDAGSSFLSLVPGMVILGIGTGLFYSSITTAAITSLDATMASLGGGIIYMIQVAGGAIGLALNTAIVVTAPSLEEGISVAFKVDAALALAGFVVALLFIGDRPRLGHHLHLRHGHRAHNP